ncbi:MAG: hypothetical protein ABI539_04850 [Acidobacteriota bacterium]
MIRNIKHRPGIIRVAKATISCVLAVTFIFSFGVRDTFGQRRFSRTYPAGKNVRLVLMNRSGMVTVTGWDRNEISISAYLELPAAQIAPQSLTDKIYINLVKDNQGRDVGSVNFEVRVPYEASVDIETTIGNLNVISVRGGLVRARINSDGDITLTNIGSATVAAENVTGNILFDGLIVDDGNYRFSSMQGRITLRIPFTASFRLVATAPSTRSIDLGTLGGGRMRLLSDGRRIVGQNGDGSAIISVTNQRGSIAFLKR